MAALALVMLLGARLTLAMDSVPKAEYRTRRVALSDKLNGGAAVVFAGVQPLLDFLPYRQDSDFFYLTGWTEPGAAIAVIGPGPATTVARVGTEVPAHGYREILFLPERDLVMEKYTGAKMDASTPGVKAATGFDEVMSMSALPEVLTKFVGEDRRVRGRRLWGQTDVPAARATMNFLAASFGVSDAPPENDVRSLTRELRSVKSSAEVELIRKASDASIAAQLAGMRAIRPGVRERTVAGVEIATMMADECERVSYAPIVGSGPNSTTLHYSENGRVMERGDVVVIDAAAEEIDAEPATVFEEIPGAGELPGGEDFAAVFGVDKGGVGADGANGAHGKDGGAEFIDEDAQIAFEAAVVRVPVAVETGEARGGLRLVNGGVAGDPGVTLGDGKGVIGEFFGKPGVHEAGGCGAGAVVDEAGDRLDAELLHFFEAGAEGFEGAGGDGALPGEGVAELPEAKLAKEGEVTGAGEVATSLGLVEPLIVNAVDGAFHATPEFEAI